MLILINGLPLFSKRLANDLNAFDVDSKYIFCDTYNSKLQQLKFLLLLPFADVSKEFKNFPSSKDNLNMEELLLEIFKSQV